MSRPVALPTAAARPPVPLPPLRFTGAEILRDGRLQRRSLAVEEGRIGRGPLPEVDMSGFLLLPGIVDLRIDAVEPLAAPRPEAPETPAEALARAGRAAAGGGVTTGWLTQPWSWEGGAASPDFAERLLALHAATRAAAPGDLRIRLRAETHLTEGADRLLAAVRRHAVDLVVFSDRARRVAEDPDAPADLRRRAAAVLAGAASVPRHLCRLAEAFDTMGVTYGSQDDPDGETRERFSMIGAGFADSPASRPAAAAAKAMHEPVVLPAAALLGGAPRGSAALLVAEGLCDALATAGAAPCLAQAALALVDRGLRDLPGAWALVSSGPAAIMGLTDRGSLERGRRADIVALDRETRRVEMTIARGHLTHLGPAAAERLHRVAPALGIAAE